MIVYTMERERNYGHAYGNPVRMQRTFVQLQYSFFLHIKRQSKSVPIYQQQLLLWCRFYRLSLLFSKDGREPSSVTRHSSLVTVASALQQSLPSIDVQYVPPRHHRIVFTFTSRHHRIVFTLPVILLLTELQYEMLGSTKDGDTYGFSNFEF